MKTVNEVVFGARVFPATHNQMLKGIKFRDDRPKELSDVMKDAVLSAAHEDPYVCETVARVMVQYKIPAFGEGAAKELLGAVGIFLTQLAPREVDYLVEERKARREREGVFYPRPVEKPEV